MRPLSQITLTTSYYYY